MTDVLELATRYRSRLKAELAKIEDFLRMAEELSKGGDLESRLPFSNGNGRTAEEGELKASEMKPAEGKAAEAKPAAKAEPEGKAKSGDEPKTPFDRFRAAGA